MGDQLHGAAFDTVVLLAVLLWMLLAVADLVVDLFVPPGFAAPRRVAPQGAFWSASQSMLRWPLGVVGQGAAGVAVAAFRVKGGAEAAAAGLARCHAVLKLQGEGMYDMPRCSVATAFVEGKQTQPRTISPLHILHDPLMLCLAWASGTMQTICSKYRGGHTGGNPCFATCGVQGGPSQGCSWHNREQQQPACRWNQLPATGRHFCLFGPTMASSERPTLPLSTTCAQQILSWGPVMHALGCRFIRSGDL